MAEHKNHSFSFEAIGTHWQIDIFNESFSADLQASILRRIDEFDKIYSRFRDDSTVMAMSYNAGEYVLPDDAQKLLSLYKKLYDITNGLFTPLIGNVLSDAGYDSSYSFQEKQLRKVPVWEDVMQYEYPVLSMKQPAIIDVGAGGKGYLVDIIADLLISHGVDSFLINAGGDIVHRDADNKKVRIGLEDPADSKKVVGIADIGNQSICGSATNRRKWGRFHHVMNPNTLSSPEHIIALWVVAETGLLADALATCLFFTSPEVLLRDFQFEYAIIHSDFKLEKSPTFPAEFFTVLP